ncbi:MAG: DUF1559 domain-containing protein [Planctomycetota bacterium]
MCRRIVQSLLFCWFFASAPLMHGSVLQAAEPSAEDQMTGALEVWRSGDAAEARQLFTAMIEGGSRDPRAYYYRGLIAEQLGENGDPDFEAGAALEAAQSKSTLVNRALERAQGPVRLRIEKIRAAARGKLKSDPESARQAAAYRAALEARAQGDLATASSKLAAIADGADARYSYLHGVVLAEMGELDAARAAFAEGLKKEKSPRDVALVSEALADVQGSIRQMIEEQSIEGEDGSPVTRQQNLRMVARRARMTEDEILAASNDALAKKTAMAEEEANSRRLAAAAEIAAEREAAAKKVAAAEETPETAAADRTVALKDPAADMPAEPAAEPSKEMPAENSVAESNPFLGGAVVAPPIGSNPDSGSRGGSAAPVSSVEPGPIELAYLPEASELLIYARPADLLKSSMAAPLVSSPQYSQSSEQMKAELGFDLGEVDSVTIGVANLIASMVPLMVGGAGTQQDPSAMMNKMIGGENTVIVMRTVADHNISAQLTQRGATSKDIGGVTVYVMPSADEQAPAMALFAPDARTVVMASEQGIESAMGRSSSATRPEFDFVSRASHVVLAFSSPALAGMTGSIPQLPPTVPQPIAALVDSLRGNIAGAGVSLSAGSDLNVDISINQAEANPDAASGLASTMQLAKQFGPLTLAQAPPALQPSLQEIIGGLKSSDSGTVLNISTVVPSSLFTAIMENPDLFPPISAARSAAREAEQSNNVRQLALAMHNFHDVKGHFPTHDGTGGEGADAKTGLSWRVHLLPYLEQGELYGQFKLDEPWDSEHNKALIDQMPAVFRVQGVDDPRMTTIHVFSNENGPFASGPGVSMRDITDGTSNTVMMVVAGPETAAIWTKPGGLELNEADPLSVFGTVGESISAAFIDGSFRKLPTNMDPATWPLLMQHNDGQVINNLP